MKTKVLNCVAQDGQSICEHEGIQKIKNILEDRSTCFLCKESDCAEISMKNYKNGKKNFKKVQSSIDDMIVSANLKLIAKGQAVVTGGMLFPKEAIEGETAKTQSKLSAE